MRVRPTEFFWASIACMLLAYATATEGTLDAEPEALCGTDTECLAHCPPPADDPECDGGPQS